MGVTSNLSTVPTISFLQDESWVHCSSRARSGRIWPEPHEVETKSDQAFFEEVVLLQLNIRINTESWGGIENSYLEMKTLKIKG